MGSVGVQNMGQKSAIGFEFLLFGLQSGGVVLTKHRSVVVTGLRGISLAG